MKYKRIFLMVLDSVGCGYAPDSYKYNDEFANTLLHIIEKTNVELPNLYKLGLGNIIYNKSDESLASYGKMMEVSKGKDTLTGHYEMMGLKVQEPFMTFTETGFPKELISLIEEKTGHGIIGNYSASGTEILKELGEEHIKSGKMILYTSSDSVLQIAAHEKYFGLEELYRVCEITREICLDPKWKVARIIARPFIGENSSDFKRTSNRHDYALEPFDRTILDNLKEKDIKVFSFGKINDIYCGKGIYKSYKTVSNKDGIKQFINAIETIPDEGLYFINLVDFDSLYGHRRDYRGYANALKEFDLELPNILKKLKSDDLLIMTADHGNDPTWHGTDHTREFVPLICFNKNGKNVNLNIRETFADLGATIAENFECENTKIGKSFLGEL